MSIFLWICDCCHYSTHTHTLNDHVILSFSWSVCVCVCLLCLQVSFGPEAWRWPTTCRTSWEPNRNLSSDLETGSVVNMPEGEFKIWAKAAIYTFYLCHLERIFNGIKLRSCGNFVPTNFKLNLNTLNFLLWFTFCNQKIILENPE